MQRLELPLSIDMGEYKRDTVKNKIGDKKKPFRINFNNFRNANAFYRTAADNNFRKYIKDNFDLKPVKKLAIFYKLVFKDNRKKDVNNIVSVLDKFFCDTMTELGVIEDDNYTYLPLIISSFDSLDLGGEEKCIVYLFDLTESLDREVLNDMFIDYVSSY